MKNYNVSHTTAQKEIQGVKKPRMLDKGITEK